MKSSLRLEFVVKEDEDEPVDDRRVYLEIKATTKTEVHMTPTQARTASEKGEAFSLCVVDLRGIADPHAVPDWTADLVRPLARVHGAVGELVIDAVGHVDSASAEKVGIRNTTALRYAVPADIWVTGLPFDDWVKTFLIPRLLGSSNNAN